MNVIENVCVYDDGVMIVWHMDVPLLGIESVNANVFSLDDAMMMSYDDGDDEPYFNYFSR